jgi:dipeptidyl aminopeptidase/acylaminoacyl peptidase
VVRQARDLLFIGAFLSCILTPSNVVLAQDGRILVNRPITPSESAIKDAESRNPAAGKWHSQMTISEITYLSDGLKINGFLLVPSGAGKFPCVIYNRGGTGDLGALVRERVPFGLLAKIASAGYVVVASQYRGNNGSEGRDTHGGADVNDVLNLIPLLGSVPQCDVGRIGMYGQSRGGMMTYLALTRTDRIRAAVVDAGSADLFDMAKERPKLAKLYLDAAGASEADAEAVFAERSAVRWPEKLNKNTPLLLLHGTSDWRVRPEEVFAVAQALYRTRHPFRLVLFEGGQHNLVEHRDEADRILVAWFDKYVRDREPWPALEPHGR